MPRTRDICFTCVRAMNDLHWRETIECTGGAAGSSQCSRCQRLNKVCITPAGDTQDKLWLLVEKLTRTPPFVFQSEMYFHAARSDIAKILNAAPADQDATGTKDDAYVYLVVQYHAAGSLTNHREDGYKAEKLELLRRQTVAMEAIAETLKKDMAP
ncbi:hypothetical protein PGQ11_009447 [Apiospora arundinis]|uniref:Uncharacterized protein n=1 Tax=Apiospora arundinis TaxID=335852 RepID=A0ABR2II09_9PEZI